MTATQKNPRELWALGLFAVSAVLVTAVRLRLADFPLERDEGEYAYVAQLLLQGIPPYAAAYSMKFPGIYLAYAAWLALFGQTAFAIRLGLLAVNLATMYLVFALGRRLDEERTGAVAGVVYGLMSLSVSVLGFAAHATHFVVLFGVAGLLLLLRAIDARRAWRLFASGLLLGLAYTMKQHGVVFAAFGAFWLLVEAYRDPSARAGEAIRRLSVYGAGAALPFVAVAGGLYLAGVFDRFWLWNFVYGGSYASSETLANGLANLGRAIWIMQALAGFGVLAAIGLIAPFWDAKKRRLPLFLGSLLLFSALAAVPGGHFRHHYFIPLWPAVALLSGVAVSAIARRVNRSVAAASLIAAAAVLVASEHTLFFRTSAVEFSRAVYGGNPFPESIEIAAFVKANTSPDDRVAVLGSEPQIFFYSGRRSASGYIYMYPLTELQPYSLPMQQEFVAEIAAARPALVILVDSFTSWLWRPGSERHAFDWARTYLEREYEVAGIVEIPASGSKSVWGNEAQHYSPSSDDFVVVFRRANPAQQ